jgi:hypothetical protein
MEELQQRLSKLRNDSGTPPLASLPPDSTVQSTPNQGSWRKSRPANLHGPVDSGYGSFAPSPDTQKAEFVGQSLPGTKLKYFNRSIPEQLNARFFDIKFLYTQPLLEAIRKKRRNAGDIGMKLKYLGLTEQSTELYIVIQCDKKTAKIVKKFFAQPHIDEELRPDFKVFVLDEELTRLADDDTIQVFADGMPIKTWCGVPITMSCEVGPTASATLGGIVMVEDATGKKTLYGLTASHALSDIKATGLPTPDVSDSDSESDLSDSESEASKEASNFSQLELSRSYEAPEEEVAVRSSELIGMIAHHTLDGPVPGNFDWALVGLANIKLLPNMIILADRSPPTPEHPKRRDSFATELQVRDQDNGIHLIWNASNSHHGFVSKPVSVISGHGPQAGTLTFNTSSLLIAPGQKFVQTHDLSMRPIMRLQPGDSGSWVVNESTGEVYGYVVSIDAFGEAQVMPIELVLADIKQKLQAERVWLPSSNEVDACKDKTAETASGVDPARAHQNRPVVDLDTEGLRRYLLNPEAEVWTPENSVTSPSRGYRRSRSVGARSSDHQDANLSLPEWLPHRAHGNRRSSRRLDVQDSTANTDDPRYYGIDEQTVPRHRNAGRRNHRLTARPPVSYVPPQQLSSNRMPYSPPTPPYNVSAPVSRPGPPRNAMPFTPPTPPYYTSLAPHPQSQPPLSNPSNPYSQPNQPFYAQFWAQTTHNGVSYNLPGMPPNNMAYETYMSMRKHGTDSGYASRTGSQQASPVPSPPQPRSKNNSSNDVDISVEFH